jgi:hypothetical protein
VNDTVARDGIGGGKQLELFKGEMISYKGMKKRTKMNRPLAKIFSRCSTTAMSRASSAKPAVLTECGGRWFRCVKRKNEIR